MRTKTCRIPWISIKSTRIIIIWRLNVPTKASTAILYCFSSNFSMKINLIGGSRIGSYAWHEKALRKIVDGFHWIRIGFKCFSSKMSVTHRIIEWNSLIFSSKFHFHHRCARLSANKITLMNGDFAYENHIAIHSNVEHVRGINTPLRKWCMAVKHLYLAFPFIENCLDGCGIMFHLRS